MLSTLVLIFSTVCFSVFAQYGSNSGSGAYIPKSGSNSYGSSSDSYGSNLGSYSNSGNGGGYYTAAPTGSTTGSPTASPTLAPNTTCGPAPIGCRLQPLIDPLTGGLLYCLLVCDQPVTQSPIITTTATTTTIAPAPTLSPENRAAQAQILRCLVDTTISLPSGCSFNGNGNQSPLTCGVTCLDSDTTGRCQSGAGDKIDQCLCQNMAPSPNCTYTFGGTTSPLTCPQECRATFAG